MTYKLVAGGNVIKATTDDNLEMWIPNDPVNIDWQAYQAWLAADPENNVPDPAE